MMKIITPKAKTISAMSNHISSKPLFKPALLLCTALILSACASSPTSPTAKVQDCSCPPVASKPETPPEPAKPAAAPYEKADFSQLPGWTQTKHRDFLEAFVRQCSIDGNALARRKTTPTALLEACRAARKDLAANPQMPAQLWFEANFEVWQFQQEDGSKEGLLTGYFEPMLNGSRKRQGRFTVPLYGVPGDMITVKLDDLYPELKGKRLRGRLQGDTLVPFFSRADWERIGPDREEPIVWVDDKLDAFLLQVQGSGRVKLTDGSVIRLSYADQNGHPYRSIGRVLVDRGELTAAQATIPGIRKWLAANPAKLDELLNANPSVVFFKENQVLRPEDGPVGAMGVPLTGGLSLAIDRQRVPYGSMIWIDSTDPIRSTPLQHGMLAQDTGGAIRGRIRGDYYWGTGAQAGEAAGVMRQPLKMWLIWPKGAPLPSSGE